MYWICSFCFRIENISKAKLIDINIKNTRILQKKIIVVFCWRVDLCLLESQKAYPPSICMNNKTPNNQITTEVLVSSICWLHHHAKRPSHHVGPLRVLQEVGQRQSTNRRRFGNHPKVGFVLRLRYIYIVTCNIYC